MGAGGSKQFRELGGAPVIIQTLRRFESCAEIGEVIVALPPSEAASFLGMAGEYGLRKVARVVPGGATRAESVWRALSAIRSQTAEIIAVHDGARPLVTAQEITRTIEAAREHGAAILAAPVVDTIKEVREGRIVRTIERSRLRRALTPQCFRYSILRRAYEERSTAELDEVTDDSALVERLGVEVAVVEGDARNIKITRKEDLALAEILIQQSRPGKQ